MSRTTVSCKENKNENENKINCINVKLCIEKYEGTSYDPAMELVIHQLYISYII